MAIAKTYGEFAIASVVRHIGSTVFWVREGSVKRSVGGYGEVRFAHSAEAHEPVQGVRAGVTKLYRTPFVPELPALLGVLVKIRTAVVTR